MPGIDRRGGGGGGGGSPTGAAGGDLTGTYPNPTLNAPTAAATLGLGKYVAVGFNGDPTWIDRDAADWADVEASNLGWVQFAYNSGTNVAEVRVGVGAQLALDLSAYYSGGPIGLLEITNGDGDMILQSSAAETSIWLAPTTGQTAPILDIQNAAGDSFVTGTASSSTVLIGNRTTAAGAGADLSLEVVRNFTDPNVAIQQAFSAYGAFFGTPGASSGPLAGGTAEALVYNNGSGDVTVALCGLEGIGRVDGNNANKVALAIGVQATVVIQGSQGATDLIALSVPPVIRDGGSGTVTNAYGAKIFAPTVGTNTWSLYVEGRTQLDYLDFGERTAPASPPANMARIYTKDVAGKTGLYVLFPSGVEQQIKVEV